MEKPPSLRESGGWRANSTGRLEFYRANPDDATLQTLSLRGRLARGLEKVVPPAAECYHEAACGNPRYML